MSKIKVKPSGWYYVLAGLVLVAGISVFVVFLVNGLLGLSEGMTQMVVPGRHELKLSEAGDYTVFHEHQSVIGNKVYSTGRSGISGLQCSLRSKQTGAEIPLAPSTMNSTYSMGSRSGVSIFGFSIDSPGEYVFSAQYPPGREGPQAVLTVGHGFVRQLLTTILGGLGIMFGSILAAVAITVITYVKRRKARRRLEGDSYPLGIPDWTAEDTLPPIRRE